MGLLDSILGSVLGNATGQATPRQAPTGAGSGGNKALMALLPIVLSMLMNRQGGTNAGMGGSGGLGDILGGMLGGRGGQAGGTPGGGLGDILGGMLGGGGGGMGGLGGLLQQFQRAGFAEQADSWVSTGQNLPISPDAIGQVFGNDTLSRIARQAGISEAEASQGLSQLLPEVVDRFTPDGNLPDLDQLASSVDSLLRQRPGG
jgi:uncharacterized protein YidB (DUF937 family)